MMFVPIISTAAVRARIVYGNGTTRDCSQYWMPEHVVGMGMAWHGWCGMHIQIPSCGLFCSAAPLSESRKGKN